MTIKIKMGGKALKKCNITRLPRDKYLDLEIKVIDILDKHKIYFRIPRYFDDKDSFGDIDILYTHTEGVDEISIVEKEFQSKEIHRNGNVVSLEFCNFQVDMIRVAPKDMNMSYIYLSWSNFGKLVGIMCSLNDLMFGHTGLSSVVNLDGHSNIKYILLSSNPNEIFEFLGLDMRRFMAGFVNEAEMFDYIKTCRLYHESIYLDEKNNSFPKQRKEVFDEFGKTIMSKNNKKEFKKIPFMEPLEYFNKVAEYNAIVKDYERNQIIKSKFNGVIVNSITNLREKKLGKFMKYLREKDGFLDYVHDHNGEAAKSLIAKHYQTYNTLHEFDEI